jgi:hypothetical protein
VAHEWGKTGKEPRATIERRDWRSQAGNAVVLV